ncbi:hypothetical protein OG870_38290 [Streptomyces sp. NBC_00461]|uniref:hypothetical protein n=1 Tax=Streptomyces sp. NBC_00461 TaxID=2975750 RepID=UPI002E198AB2
MGGAEEEVAPGQAGAVRVARAGIQGDAVLTAVPGGPGPVHQFGDVPGVVAVDGFGGAHQLREVTLRAAGLHRAQLGALGPRTAIRSNSSSGAGRSTGRCGRAPGARAR